MLADLSAHSESRDEHAFADRLPYVLDLLAGVRRQIDKHRPRPAEFTVWWDQQRTPRREAITSMRNAELKSYERRSQRTALTQTYSSAGSFEARTLDGELVSHRVVNAGDTVTVLTGWKFLGGHFDGQDVLSVLTGELTDLSTLIHVAESQLGSPPARRQLRAQDPH